MVQYAKKLMRLNVCMGIGTIGYVMTLGQELQDPCSKRAQIPRFVPGRRIPKLRH